MYICSSYALMRLAKYFFIGVALLAMSYSGAYASKDITLDNKKIIEKGFEQWASATGNFFDLLDPNIKWTISGHSQFSKTYNNKEVFIEEVIKPLNEKLSVKIKPSIRNIYAEKDTVVVLWDGAAVAKDGKPYINSYAWFLKMKNGKIVEAVAFLDTADLEAIFNRIQ